MPLEAGTQLGPYEILSPLGAGGMGEVYKARDTRLDRTVAIKVLLAHVADDPDLRQRFKREVKSVAALNHPTGRLWQVRLPARCPETRRRLLFLRGRCGQLPDRQSGLAQQS